MTIGKRFCLMCAAIVVLGACEAGPETLQGPAVVKPSLSNGELTMVDAAASGAVSTDPVDGNTGSGVVTVEDEFSINAMTGAFISSGSFNSSVTVVKLGNFEGFGAGFGFQSNPWTYNDVTYTTGSNLTVGTATGYNPPTTVFCYNGWSPMQGTVAPGYSAIGFGIGMLGSVSLVNITITTNVTTYSFPNQNIAHWTAGGSFRGYTFSAGEYVVKFHIASHQGSGSAPCIDNVALGNAQPPNAAPVANAGPDQTVDLSGSPTASVTLNGAGSTDDGQAAPLTFTWKNGATTVATGATPTITLGLGTHTLTLTVFDGEHSSSDNVVITVKDPTPPVITSNVSGTLGNNGWYTSAVTVTFSVSDAESAITSAPCASPQVQSADIATQTFSCSATSAGGTSNKSETLKKDGTNPTITFSGTTSYTVDQTVLITCSATDAMSGLASSSCPAVVSGPAYGFSLGVNTASESATDNAGNSASASVSFTISVTTASLCNLVKQFVSQNGIANSLCVKLENAEKATNANARSNMLNAFRNEVSAQSGKAMTAVQAAVLTALSNAL